MLQSGTTAEPRIRLVHSSPRRFRLKVPRGDRTPETMAGIRRRLESTPGVTRADVNPDTGSVLVHHDVNAAFEDLLERAGLSENVLLAAVPPRLRHAVRGEASRAAAGVTDWFFAADARLARATGGWLDLKMAIPIGLFSAAAWRSAAEGAAFLEIPPYILLWYAFDSFMKFHQPTLERQPVSPQRVNEAGQLAPEEGADL
jgi:hypothetical protein